MDLITNDCRAGAPPAVSFVTVIPSGAAESQLTERRSREARLSIPRETGGLHRNGKPALAIFDGCVAAYDSSESTAKSNCVSEFQFGGDSSMLFV